MPRLLHVLSHLYYDGASTQVRLLTAAARETGEAVAVASLRRPGVVGEELRTAGVPVTWLQRRFTVDPFAARNLRRLVASWKPDAVQSWDPDSAAFCRRVTVPWLHTVRKAEPLPRGTGSAAGIIAADERAASAAHAGGVAESRITLIPNAFDPAIAPVAASDKQAARSRLRLSGVDVGDETPVILSVARINDATRINEIAWASDLVRVVRPGLRLLIVGDGPDRMACERFAAAATEPGTVGWLGPQADLATCLAAADVVWCASANDVAPTPAIEAMAAGKPLVVADTPGRAQLAPDPSDDSSPCCRVPWNDRAAWARVTKRLLEKPTLAEQIGRENAGRARHKHELAAVAKAHADAVARAVAQG